MKQPLHIIQKLPRYLATAIIILLIATGTALIGNGLWIKVKAELAQILLNQAFSRAQKTPESATGTFKPWSWADIEPVARLNAPRLNKSAIILNNTSGEALAFGPGHLGNTPLPGERGTSVLAAHRDTHFSWIKDLQSGDRLEVERTDGNRFAYIVTRAWVAPYNASGINADSEDRLLALSTCYPFGTNSPGPLRYIVEAEIDARTATASLADL
jgi:sortase A